MPLLRRVVPADPRVVARLTVLLPDEARLEQGLPDEGGWVPPGYRQPGAGAATEPVATEPAATESVATELVATELVATEPVVTEPDATVQTGTVSSLGGDGPSGQRRGRHAAPRAVVGGPRPRATVEPVVATEEPEGSQPRGPWTWSALAAAAHEPAGPPDGEGSADVDGERVDDVDDVDDVDEPRAGEPAGSVLDRWRSGRIDPGRRGVAALALVAVLAAGLAAFVVLRSRPAVVSPPPVVASGVPVPGSSAAASPSPGGQVVVSVAGKVLRPGLLVLPVGSRVDDALRAAGGAAQGADLTGLNLARRLVDGEQLLVGLPPPVTTGADAPAGGGDPVVDLNTATLAQFDSLPGIGPVLAQKLLDWRTAHGRFGSVDQLREVGGIGESKYAEIKNKVRV